MKTDNFTAQKLIIGTLVDDPLKITEIVDVLNPEVFTNHILRAIYKAIIGLYLNKQRITPETIADAVDEIYQDGQLLGFITALSKLTICRKHVRETAQALIDNNNQRQQYEEAS